MCLHSLKTTQPVTLTFVYLIKQDFIKRKLCGEKRDIIYSRTITSSSRKCVRCICPACGKCLNLQITSKANNLFITAICLNFTTILHFYNVSSSLCIGSSSYNTSPSGIEKLLCLCRLLYKALLYGGTKDPAEAHYKKYGLLGLF